MPRSTPIRTRTHTDSLRLGTLVHGLALTPSQFEREFFVADYERRSHAGKARYAALSATGLTVIKPAEMEKARAIVAALHAHPDAKRLLPGGKKERLILQPRTRIVAAQGPAGHPSGNPPWWWELKTT